MDGTHEHTGDIQRRHQGERGGGGGAKPPASERGCDVGPSHCEAGRDFPFKSEPGRGGVGLIIAAGGGEEEGLEALIP